MKSCKIFIRVITILVVLVGVIFGDEVGSDGNLVVEGSGTETCPLSEEHGQKPMKQVFLDRLDKCFSGVDREMLEQVGNLEEFKKFFKEYCQKQDLITQCVSISTDDAAVCLNETEYNDVRFVIDTFKNGLKNGCFNDGEYLSVVLNVLYISDTNVTSDETSGNSISECINTAIETRDGNSIDSKSLQFYREFKVFKKCLLRKLYGNDRAAFLAQYMLDRILRDMQCPHPELNTRVFCETLENPINTTIDLQCPFHEPSEELFTFGGVLCLNMKPDAFKGLTSVEDVRTFFKNYCDTSPQPVHRCLGDLSNYSKVCQNHSTHQIFEAIRHNIDNSILKICKDDGNKFAILVNGLMNNALNRNVVNNCFDVAATRYRNDTSTITSPSDRTQLAYIALRQAKSCIQENISEGELKNMFISFWNEVLKNATCIHPEEDRMVACETISPQP